MTGPEGRELEDGRKDEQRDCEKDKTARLSRAKLFLVCSRREPPAKEWSHTGFLMSSKLFSLVVFIIPKHMHSDQLESVVEGEVKSLPERRVRRTGSL